MIAAVILGPILAVQVQKRIEKLREKWGRKNHLFQILMSTRASRLSPDHVQALNMIDLVFYGIVIFGVEPLPMKIQQPVTSESDLDNQKRFRDLIFEFLEGKRKIPVEISKQ